MSDDLATRIERVRARIAAAAERCGRSPEDVTLIAVTKGMPDQVVADALNYGLMDLGENRAYEGGLRAAYAIDGGLPYPRWHLIGHLQRSNVRPSSLRWFRLLHGIDSPTVLRRIDREMEHPAQVLIQVNVSGEASKHGVPESYLPTLVALANGLPNIRLTGLMTIAPLVDDPEETRPVFRRLRELAEMHGLPNLSMGMTNDFEVAIEEGATHVRVGRALFGERPA